MIEMILHWFNLGFNFAKGKAEVQTMSILTEYELEVKTDTQHKNYQSNFSGIHIETPQVLSLENNVNQRKIEQVYTVFNFSIIKNETKSARFVVYIRRNDVITDGYF
jgi:hypothetical protein